MRVVSLTIGTRGDVQPFVALHRKLEELALPGDSKPCTTIVTSRDFRGFVEGDECNTEWPQCTQS